MMPNHKMRGRDWKDEIVTELPELEDAESLEDQPVFRKELKADILEVISDLGKRRKKLIFERLPYEDALIEDGLNDLVEEGVLEVEKL